MRDGRLARAHARAPSAPDLSSFAPVPPPAPAPPPTLAPAPAPAPLPIRGASRWNEIHISSIDPTTVRIDLPGASLRRTHVDLGMAHPRNRQPTRVWELLVELCDGHGIFHGRRFGSADATKKLVSRLRPSAQGHLRPERSRVPSLPSQGRLAGPLPGLAEARTRRVITKAPAPRASTPRAR